MEFAQRYAALADSITHGKTDVEKSILAPHFQDQGKIKLDAYEYDPLTVQVLHIEPHGNTFFVRARYVGVNGKTEDTVDLWLVSGDSLRLAKRSHSRP
jgi:hypothetical protein